MRRTIEDCRRIDAYQSLREGYITHGDPVLRFTDNGFNYSVPVTWRQASVGNSRPNFVCKGCNQPKVKLALTEPGRLECQTCSGLPNRSRQQTRHQRAAESLRQLQKRTGREDWENVSEPVLRRPSRMHNATFDRLVEQGRAAYNTLKESPGYRARITGPLMVCR